MTIKTDALGRSCLATLRQSGATKLVFPRQTSKSIDVILVNTAGGITGGDRFDLNAKVQSGAHLTLSTQAAERAYRAQPGEVGHVTTTLSVASGGQLDWLPQELILFERSALHRRLDIDLAPSARLVMAEAVVFGRAAMGEALHDITFKDRITIRQDGRPIYFDGLDLRKDAQAVLAQGAIANGAGAMASVVLVRPDAAKLLPAVRNLLPATAGASAIQDDVLVVRHLASDSFMLRRDLVAVLECLCDRDLPTSWRL